MPAPVTTAADGGFPGLGHGLLVPPSSPGGRTGDMAVRAGTPGPGIGQLPPPAAGLI